MTTNTRKLMNSYGAAGIPFLFIIDFEQQKPVILTQVEWEKEDIWFQFEGMAFEHGNITSLPPFIEFEKYPVDLTTYKKAFDYVHTEIGKGNSFLVNLTFSTPITTNLSLNQIYVASQARYKLRFRDYFVCFSPETFVKINKGIISTYPMKGTIDARIPNAREIILNDKKEFAEHVTVVDLLRNDLSMMAEKVKVKRFRYIEELDTYGKQLLQVSSHIEGLLPNNYASRIGDIICNMLPAGSISGAPKPKTLEIIKQAENHDRAYYTGIVGYFDGQNLDSGVMIRFIEQTPKGLVYKSGGGITWQSKLEDEYQELIDKVYLPINKQSQSFRPNNYIFEAEDTDFYEKICSKS